MSSEHERILKSSVQEWNNYVQEQVDQEPFWKASLQGGDLCNEDLSGANLRNARLSRANLSGANLSGVNLSGANLRDAILKDALLRDALLRDANLVGANLKDALLASTLLKGADLSGVNMSGAILSGADLSGANLAGANCERALLARANLAGANCERALLARADLRGAILAGANLSDVILSGAKLNGTILAGANLSGVICIATNFSGVIHSGADLRDALLADADLRGVLLADADLRGVLLADADLRGVLLADADLRDVMLQETLNVLGATTVNELPGLMPHSGHAFGIKQKEMVSSLRLVLTIDAQPGMDTSEFSALASGLDALMLVSQRINSKPTGGAAGGGVAVAVDSPPENWKISYFQYGSPWQVVLDYVNSPGVITGSAVAIGAGVTAGARFAFKDLLEGDKSRLINLFCLLGRSVERKEFLERRRLEAKNRTMEEKCKGAKLRASLRLQPMSVDEVKRRLEEAGLDMESDQEKIHILDNAHLMCRQRMSIDIYAPSENKNDSPVD